MFSGKELAKLISDIFVIHQEFPKKPQKAFRKFDGRTPYGIHPTLLAMLFLHEDSLPEDLRVRGAKALLAHDLIEDTTNELPEWCCEAVVLSLVNGLTFTEDEDPMVEIWKRDKEVILLKFYDQVANLMCVAT